MKAASRCSAAAPGISSTCSPNLRGIVIVIIYCNYFIIFIINIIIIIILVLAAVVGQLK